MVVREVVVGVLVAWNHNYLGSLETARRVGSAILATLLWPLLFLGISLHIH